MGFITLDDRSGRIEASLFADSFQAAQSLLQTDAMVVVEGEVSSDDFSGGLRLRAKRVMSLEEARTGLAESLRLTVRSEALKGDRLRWLGDLCRKHRERVRSRSITPGRKPRRCCSSAKRGESIPQTA